MLKIHIYSGEIDCVISSNFINTHRAMTCVMHYTCIFEMFRFLTARQCNRILGGFVATRTRSGLCWPTWLKTDETSQPMGKRDLTIGDQTKLTNEFH